MEIEVYLDYLLEKNKARMKIARNVLRTSPKGKLYEEKKDGTSYFLQYYTEDGQRVRRGMTKSPELVEELVRKEIFSKELDALESREAVLKKCKTQLVEFDMAECIKALRKRCPNLPVDLIEKAIKCNTVNEWAGAEYEQSDYMPDQKTQMTSFGLKVRSKSELLIAEKLHEYEIPFRYEQVLHIGENSFIPDFSIKRADGKKFIWEHEGRTHDSYYLEKQLAKEKMYASVGFVRWDNLIVTYDDKNGNIDLRIVESEIRNKLLI